MSDVFTRSSVNCDVDFDRPARIMCILVGGGFVGETGHETYAATELIKAFASPGLSDLIRHWFEPLLSYAMKGGLADMTLL